MGTSGGVGVMLGVLQVASWVLQVVSGVLQVASGGTLGGIRGTSVVV